MAETPELVTFHAEYQPRGVSFVSLSIDFPDEVDTRVKPFVAKHKVPFPVHVMDGVPPEEIISAFGLESSGWDGALPATFVIDRGGAVRQSWLGVVHYEDLAATVDPLI